MTEAGLEEQAKLTAIKLEEAKSYVKLFGLDYDGTISDGKNYKNEEVKGLVEKILNNDKAVAFITARAATALKTFVPLLQEVLQENRYTPAFIAGGNGTNLYDVKKNGLYKIYNHGLNLEEIKRIALAGRQIYFDLRIRKEDLCLKGIDTFQKFLGEGWKGYIPDEILNVCRPYDGKFFSEEAQVTFVLSDNKSKHGKIIGEFNKRLGNRYQALAGDNIYLHITKKLNEDSKRTAIKSILKIMNLNENQVVTFGDMPFGNDAGLLSFPYSFTNSDEFARNKKDLNKPPYALIDEHLSPVARVYKTIENIIE